ncbi:MAG: SIR2 family NAD-dependent protein deacylase [Myxococcota bacterium]
MDHATLDRAADALREASSVLVITGAGVSAESGIPTFRGPGGLWEGFRPEELATPEAFRADPARVWRWYRWRRAKVHACDPNPGHGVIAAMDAFYPDFLLATQNVDGLHRRAGSRRLVELHGTIERMRCTECHRLEDLPGEADADAPPVPTCAACGASMRPHVLWFGETYWPGVMEDAQAAAERADATLVVGTSAQVWAPAALAMHARRSGAFLIDVNPNTTSLSETAQVHLAGPSGVLLPKLWERVGA